MYIYSLPDPIQKYNFQDYICLLRTWLKDGFRAQTHAHLTKQMQQFPQAVCYHLLVRHSIPPRSARSRGVSLWELLPWEVLWLSCIPWTCSLPSADGHALTMHSRTTDWAVFLIETRAPSPVMRSASRLPRMCWAALRFCWSRGACQHQGSPGAQAEHTHPPPMMILISRPSCFLLPLCQAIAPHNCWQNTARASSLCSLGKIRQAA